MPLICQFKQEYKCFILIYFNYNGCIVYSNHTLCSVFVLVA